MMRQLIYAKYATERAKEFQIRTDILEDGDSRVVRKAPQTAAAHCHVEKLAGIYEKLMEEFAGSEIEITPCRLEEDGAYFEYIRGQNLEEILDELLEAGEKVKLVEVMQQYFDLIRDETKLVPFEKTEAFTKIFGEVKTKEALLSRKVTDVDMIFANLVNCGNKSYLLDYEWTFDFPIPVNYIIYRSLHYYVLGSQKRTELKLSVLYKQFGITREQQMLYEEMETAFQNYVRAGSASTQELWETISPGSIDVPAGLELKSYLQVYIDCGGGYPEKTSVKQPIARGEQIVTYTMELTEHMRGIRIDPMNDYCIYEIRTLTVDGKQLTYLTDDCELETGKYVAVSDDPLIQIPLKPDTRGILQATLWVKKIDRDISQFLCGLSAKEEAEDRKVAIQPNIICNIDRVEKSQLGMQIYGWAFCEGSCEIPQIQVIQKNGQELKVTLVPYERGDVNEIYHIKEGKCIGFVANIGQRVEQGEDIRVVFSTEGCTKDVVCRSREFVQDNFEIAYKSWLLAHTADEQELARQRETKFPVMPLISIVIPTYNTTRSFLRELIESVRKQSYQNWELCFADGSTKGYVGRMIKRLSRQDSRIRYQKLADNKGISENTNEAIRMAKGDWIMFSDHDDILVHSALYEMVVKINEDAEIDAVYTDEDKVSADGRIFYDPCCKTDYNLTMLREYNYITHIFAVRRKLMEEVGCLRAEFDGAQDYDFVLRCCERARKVGHIPKILYHWRAHMASTAMNSDSKTYAYEAGRAAVAAHYERLGIQAEVTQSVYKGHYESSFALEGQPMVSVVIPNKDHTDTLDTCIQSILEKTDYPNYEILIVENNSTESETFAYYNRITAEHDNIRVEKWKQEFNYAAIHNFAVPLAKGEYVMLLNNDIEITMGDWMGHMLGYCQQQDVGIVGIKLMYPDDTVQHAGVVVGIGGSAGHIFYGDGADDVGYCTWLVTSRETSCVTAACLMTKKSVYEKVQGMDERLVVAYNDVDYCLKVREAGYKVVYDAHIWAYHYESKTRGYEDTPEKKERLQREADILTSKWKDYITEGDPYYNENLTLDAANCSLRGI